MNYTKQEGAFISSDGCNRIKYFVYVPEITIVGMMQISHGMCEYVERYEPFIDFLTERGILVFGNDHLGHKGSVRSKEDLGYMGHSDGWKHMYEDVHTMSLMLKEEYPKLKLVLFGHSMGSFVARAVLEHFSDDYDGAILCGTSGKNPMAGIGKILISVLRIFRGERAKSALVTKGSFGNYNKYIEKVSYGFEWLTRDEDIVRQYVQDENCNFKFSLAGYYDLMSLLSYVSRNAWYESVKESFPLFVISGDRDPVGNWGEGIKEVDQKLRRKKRSDYRMKLYPDMRHELINEIGKEEVYEDIYTWIKERL